jgi:hypothetical protein
MQTPDRPVIGRNFGWFPINDFNALGGAAGKDLIVRGEDRYNWLLTVAFREHHDASRTISAPNILI